VGGEAEERERENLKQVLHPAQTPLQGSHNPEIMT